MTTSNYIGIDVSKDRLDVAILGEKQTWQTKNTLHGVACLVKEMVDLEPELIAVEATGGTGELWRKHCFMRDWQ